LLTKLADCNFDKVYVDTDSNEVKEFTSQCGYEVIDRLPELAKDSANGNDLLNYHRTIIEADVYFQLFVTAPLLKTDTIKEAVHIMEFKRQFDSILTAQEIFSWFWCAGKPVNYDPAELPRSQDAVPIVRETTGLYGIRKEALEKYQCRIGSHPYFLLVNPVEAMDVDDQLDFKMAELFLKYL
jgi:N-acylneuraminate cytidylyltransferase